MFLEGGGSIDDDHSIKGSGLLSRSESKALKEVMGLTRTNFMSVWKI